MQISISLSSSSLPGERCPPIPPLSHLGCPTCLFAFFLFFMSFWLSRLSHLGCPTWMSHLSGHVARLSAHPYSYCTTIMGYTPTILLIYHHAPLHIHTTMLTHTPTTGRSRKSLFLNFPAYKSSTCNLGHFGPFRLLWAIWATLGHLSQPGQFGPPWATLGHVGLLLPLHIRFQF